MERASYVPELTETQNQPLRSPPATSTPRVTSNSNRRSPLPFTPPGKGTTNTSDVRPASRVNGLPGNHSDEDIPENMYRPDKDHPEGWIHRDKLAKIESEELQAAGINLANARSRSQSKQKTGTDTIREVEKRDEKRQRLESPAEIDDETDPPSWDFRLPEEIEAESAAAAQMYTNPVLRKSGSKIPIMTGSPLPIPAERYERDTPIARKRTASGTMSLEVDLNIPKTRNNNSQRSAGDSDDGSSAVVSSKPASPSKPRSKSATMSSGDTPSGPRKSASVSRKVSAPPRATPSPSQRQGARPAEQDRPRTATNRPEGDPPWLATMYKPDPRLPPDQQLIPTLAKKQQEALWAEQGAIPKAYDREFTPIAVHSDHDLYLNRTPSPVKEEANPEKLSQPQPEPEPWNLLPVNRTNSGRPGTSGSITGGYSTMPKVVSPPIREPGSPKPNSGSIPPVTGGRSTTMPAPRRMQAQNLDMEEDEKTKKGCGCCVVM